MPGDRTPLIDHERDLFRGRVERLYEILKRLDDALSRADIGRKQRKILEKAVNSIQLDNPPYSRGRLLVNVRWITERALEARVKILLLIAKEALKEGRSTLGLDWFAEIEKKMSCINFCLIDAGHIIRPLAEKKDPYIHPPVATLVKDFVMSNNKDVIIQEQGSMMSCCCAVL
ncbi:hypothetical protein [Piscirickettsia salmonis]|uniref:hypothetical protein n=1 Tax=Piscirickettsia salmonis TaxID=1238 RepID=UPI0007C8DEB0|nr:hypothetical protein A0O36_01055 [Piscirickettsiaceae bacterium NZ-RLO1]